MKNKFKYLLLTSACLLTACQAGQPKASSDLGDPLFIENINDLSDEEKHKYSIGLSAVEIEHNRELADALNVFIKHLNEMDKVQMKLTMDAKYQGQTMSQSQSNQELYKEGVLQESLLNRQGPGVDSHYYYKDEKTYFKTLDSQWEEDGTSRRFLNYVSLAQVILSDSHLGHLEMKQEGGLTTVSKELTDKDLEGIEWFVDYPYFVHPLGAKKGQISLSFDSASGEGRGMDLAIQFLQAEEELGTYHLKAEMDFGQELDLAVDLEEKVQKVEGDFLETFKELNTHPYADEYVMFKEDRVDGKSKIKAYYYTNYPEIDNTGFSANIDRENKLTNMILHQAGKSYSYKDENFEVKDEGLFPYYNHYVNRFIDEFSNLKHLDSTDSDKEIYREAMTDYQTFNQITKGMNTSFLEQGANTAYCIDYLVDPQTHRLKNVYVWSLAEDQEEIGDVITLDFGDFNAFNINSLSRHLPKTFWEQIES